MLSSPPTSDQKCIRLALPVLHWNDAVCKNNMPSVRTTEMCAKNNKASQLNESLFTSDTAVQSGRKTHGTLLLARGFRQGCPANCFLFVLASGPVFRRYIAVEFNALPRLVAPLFYGYEFAVTASKFFRIMRVIGGIFAIIER